MAFRFAQVHGVPFQNASQQNCTSVRGGQMSTWENGSWSIVVLWIRVPSSPSMHKKLKVNSCIFTVFYLQMFPPQSLLRLKTPSSAAFDGTRICDISRWLHRIGIMFLSGGCMWDESNFRQDTTKLFGYVFPFLELSHRLLGVLRVWPQPMYMNVIASLLHGLDPATPQVKIQTTCLSSMKSKRAMEQLSSRPVPPRTLWSPVPEENGLVQGHPFPQTVVGKLNCKKYVNPTLREKDKTEQFKVCCRWALRCLSLNRIVGNKYGKRKCVYILSIYIYIHMHTYAYTSIIILSI